MDEKTLTALKGSIEKWEKIVNENGNDNGKANCPLCDLFHKFALECKGCPVITKSGIWGCSKTPLDKWNEHQGEIHNITRHPYKVECSTCKAIAREELNFLKSLLPKPIQKEMDEEDLVALRESISDWEEKAKGKAISRECPLCTLGIAREGSSSEACNNCIIKKHTGQSNCYRTPFHNDRRLGYPTYQQNMVEFLKSLLPLSEWLDRHRLAVDYTKKEEGMKQHDIVESFDSSYSVKLGNEKLEKAYNISTGKVYIVIATNLKLPTEGGHGSTNDTIIQELKDKDYIFTQKRFLKLKHRCDHCPNCGHKI